MPENCPFVLPVLPSGTFKTPPLLAGSPSLPLVPEAFYTAPAAMWDAPSIPAVPAALYAVPVTPENCVFQRGSGTDYGFDAGYA